MSNKPTNLIEHYRKVLDKLPATCAICGALPRKVELYDDLGGHARYECTAEVTVPQSLGYLTHTAVCPKAPKVIEELRAKVDETQRQRDKLKKIYCSEDDA